MNIGKSFKTEEILGIGLFTLSIVSLLIMLKVGLNQSIWEDEAYTLNLISKSFIDMVFTIAGHDVHPPLYYLILKSVFQFFSLFLPLKTFNAVFTFNSNYLLNVIVAKLTSTIPLFLLFIFSFTRLRKDFGWLISGIFAFCIITMPNIMNYGLEIRMYSWAMLFVTLSFYYSYKITIESSKTNWGMFIIFSLMGAYTHYYGTLAIAIINLILLLNIFLKNREKIKNWAISTTIITLGYIPWIL
ncbi:MAG: hypothetical protein LBT10_07035, partial [Methanobrevibacter sp.]|nr:hypothetical protein [Methanobrevibacter sp.]